jgi:type VI secretion system protein ImpF
MSRDSSETQSRLAHLVEEAIATFEPRLSGVKVSLVTNETNRFGELRFVIDGLLRMDPSPERISFDTLLQTSSGQVRLGGEGNA